MAVSANNGWVDSYLEALLSYGLSTEYSKSPANSKSDNIDADRQIYAKYYVSQIMQLGEEGIRDAWSKATSARHYGEKDARLEYLSWRVWFMKRNRALAKMDAQQRAAAGLVEDISRVHADDETSDEEPMLPATSTGSKGVSFKLPKKESSLQKVKEGEKFKEDVKRPPAIQTKPPQKDPSADFLAQEYVSSPPALADTPPGKDLFEGRVDGLYLVLISLHGLVRGERMELGKDPDTGGQVKYVVELARALAQHPAVFRVDLLTRLIQDPSVDPSYGEPEESIWKAPDDPGMGGAYIVRLPCGPPKTYLRKEKLWPHIREFADRGIAHTKHMLGGLSEAGTPCELYAVHGHYADAGEVAALMSSTLGVDMVMTGHSLGRNKLEHLLGTMSKKEIEENYAISRRIEAEERALETATMVLTSTQQEIDEQWGLYDGYDVKLERVLRARHRVGRSMPLINVIPPGLDFSSLKVDLPKDPSLSKGPPPKHAFFSQQSSAASLPTSPNSTDAGSPGKPLETSTSDLASMDEDGEKKSVTRTSTAQGLFPFIKEEPYIWQEIFRFLRNPRKPAILAMSRPDAKKNITTLVKAFGENPTLRELANLVLIMGNRENIDGMAPGSQKILTQVMKLIDAHDLYGSVAYPKKHEQKDISDIYLLPYATRGIFTNVALQEPFGLTVIEAAAHGVPTVATKNGGPVDIMATLHHGLLVDPTNSKQIADALLKILTNPEVWDVMSHNGVANIMAYSWFSHCKKYLEALELEKRFIKTQKRFQSRLSGNWDASTLKLEEVMGSPKGAEESNLNRLASMPAGRSPKGVRRVPSNSQVVHASDDAGLTGHSSDDRSHGQPVGDTRKRFAAVALDGVFRVPAVAPLLIKLIKARNDAKAADLGIGIVSMLGFSTTCKALQEAEVPLQELDWMVCNSGADIWHLLQSKDGKARTWSSDEQWDIHITFRWDRDPLARAVTKLVSNDKKETLASAPTLQKALALMTDTAQQEHHVHPHHIMLPLDADAKSILDMGPRATGKDAVATVVVDKMRRRMRQNGYHAHITLQMAVEDEQVMANVHITPMRASRALALRYLATKFGTNMENIVLVAIAPSLEKTGEVSKVTAYTSDLIELVSGVSPVYIAGAAAGEQQAAGRAAKHDSYALDKISIRVSPKVFGARIRCLADDGGLAAALDDIVAGRVAGGYEGNKPGGAHDDDE